MVNRNETQKCKKCNKTKPISDFVFEKRLNHYLLICKECDKAYHREYYKKMKEKNSKSNSQNTNSKTKVCIKCKKRKAITNFSFDKSTGKYINTCKSCKADISKNHYKKNKEKVLEYQKEYRITHKEYLDEYHAEYRKKNAVKRNEYSKQYNKEHQDDIKLKRKIYREEHKEEKRKIDKEYALNHKDEIAKRYKIWAKKHSKQLAEYNKQYREEKAEEIKQKRKEYDKKNRKRITTYYLNKRAKDPLFKLSTQVRNLIRVSLKKNGYSKDSSTYEILGCDYETLMKHLKKSWKRWYGTDWNGEPYHIDHIIPLALAKTKEEIIDLCYYKNLQMLKPHDNLVKNKY